MLDRHRRMTTAAAILSVAPSLMAAAPVEETPTPTTAAPAEAGATAPDEAQPAAQPADAAQLADGAAATSSKSDYNLFNPTPRGALRPMSPDRPDLHESPYTVDAGRVQLEVSFFGWGTDKPGGGAATVTGLEIAPLLLKVGVLNNVDLQLGLAPYTTTKVSGASSSVSGFGDTVIRAKINLLGNDDGDTAFGVMPFVSLPTAADGLGSDAVEGGLKVMYQVALSSRWALGLMVEADLVKSAEQRGHVIDVMHTATVGGALAGSLGGYLEYAGFTHLSGEEDFRGYVGGGLTYNFSDDLQIDGGVRAGVSDAAEDLYIFSGVSTRY